MWGGGSKEVFAERKPDLLPEGDHQNKVDGTVFAVGIGSHGPASAGGRRVSGTTVPVRDNSR